VCSFSLLKINTRKEKHTHARKKADAGVFLFFYCCGGWGFVFVIFIFILAALIVFGYHDELETVPGVDATAFDVVHTSTPILSLSLCVV